MKNMSLSAINDSVLMSSGALLTYVLFDSFGQEVVSLSPSCRFETWIENYSPSGNLLALQSPSLNNKFSVNVSNELKLHFSFQPVPSLPSVRIQHPITVKFLPEDVEDFEPLHVKINVSLCPIGAYLRVDSRSTYLCVNCPAGLFADLSGTSNSSALWCLSCPAGKSSFLASTTCYDCPPGKMTFQSGSASCVECSPGTFANSSAAQTCTLCPVAKYQERPGQTGCDECFENSITLSPGSDSHDECICPESSFGTPAKGVKCRLCVEMEGVTCPHNSSVPVISEGLWRYPDRPNVILRCIGVSACPASDSADSVCNEGYTGHLCGLCVQSSHFQADYACVKCSGTTFLWILLALCFGLFLAVTTRTTLYNSSTATFEVRIAVVWIQVLSLYPKISTTWPSYLLNFFRTTQIFNFEAKAFSPCKCP
jgi:hypothetical protein